MGQFGVLVESIGFKAREKSSAPLADLKNTNKSNDVFPRDVGFNSNNNSINVDDLDGIFKSNKNNQNSGFDDVFGGFDSGININYYNNGGMDLDSVFNVSNSNNYNTDDFNDDVFGFKKTSLGTSSVDHYDVLGNKVSPVKMTNSNSNSVDDLLGNLGGMGVKSSSSDGKQANASTYDDLLGSFSGNGMKSNGLKKNSVKKKETASDSEDFLSGFGVKASSSNGRKAAAIPSPPLAKSFSASIEDPFVMFERTQGSSKPNNRASGVDDYLDSFFSPGTQSKTRQNQSPTTEDSVYDALFNNNVVSKQETKGPFQSSHNTKKTSSNANNTDEFSYLFGMGDAPPSGEFQEIKGESEDRRKARYNHYITTRERMIKALNEKNNRDLQAQREQDEKHRVGATLEGDIKRWAVGKEGNLRALLSSLQQVLWSGSGWQPISLTDLITSTAVKKAYYKATLFVHPDKVQQKGANVQQKYIAEKVFDLLKEAWNKFNAEEFKKQ